MNWRCFAFPGSSSRGFSLVELMIASALGMIIVAWLTQLLADTGRINREIANTSEMIERGRFAMQRLREDASHAGFWGAFVPSYDDLTWTTPPTDVPNMIPDPCANFSTWAASVGHIPALVGVPLQVHASSPGVSCNALLGAELKAAATDVLVIRHADTCAVGGEQCSAEVAGTLYFLASNCAHELASGRLYSLDPNALPLTEIDCSSRAARRRFIQNIYFIRNNARDIPSLYRSEFGLASGELRQRAAQELVPGVERFRVSLGVDSLSETRAAVNHSAALAWQDPLQRRVAANRGDGVPDGAYVYCTESEPCTGDQFINTAVIKVYMLVRAGLPSPGYRDVKTYQLGDTLIGPFNDAYKRHIVASTVRIHNVAGRRETP